jgi:release factor glutamine methyltransferase
MALAQRSRRDAAAHTWASHLARAEARLADAGSPSPALDAAVLLQWVTHVPAARLIAEGQTPLSAEQVALYDSWVARRAQHEPVAYITGHKAFMGLDLYVDRRTLLVRPLSQALVEIVLELARLSGRDDLIAADVGTGSGALALALAALEPGFARIYGTDCSAEALAVARINGARHGMDGRITWLEGDLLAPVPEAVDYLLANLPYIPADLPGIAPSVRDYEPPVALYGGPDGLDLLRRFLTQVPAKLRPGGALVMEIGSGQRRDVEALLRASLPAARIHAPGQATWATHLLVAECPNEEVTA